MKEVIEKIIQIEKEAHNVMSNALLEKQAKEKEHGLKLSKLKEGIHNDAIIKVNQIRSRELEETEKDIKLSTERTAERIKRMREIADKNMDNWVEELTNRILA